MVTMMDMDSAFDHALCARCGADWTDRIREALNASAVSGGHFMGPRRCQCGAFVSAEGTSGAAVLSGVRLR